MKTALSLFVLTLSILASTAAPLGTAFTYQGKLASDGQPADGLYDMTFRLYAALSGGSTASSAITTNAVSVSNGLFKVALDFGSNPYDGNARWLEIRVRTNGASSYVTLSPRQELTPAPYAIYTLQASSATTASSASSATTATTANNLSGSLAGDVTGTQAATVIASVGGQTATAIASGTAAANAAASSNAANAIVKRDANGSFVATNITLQGNLNFPPTSANAGVINSGANRFLHAYAGNTFVGVNAGNFTSNAYNTGVGQSALTAKTTGLGNTGIGNSALTRNTTGRNNTAAGNGAMYQNIIGESNTGLGANALYSNTNGIENIASGYNALFYNRSGSANTALGAYALQSNTTGSNNIAMGYRAGYNLDTGSTNIHIGHEGVSGESRKIRIGKQGDQTNTFIAGIFGSVSAAGLPVGVDSAGMLGTLAPSALHYGMPISSAPYAITQPGSYFLTTNLTVATNDAIIIASDNVTLNLNGFTISSTSSAPSGVAIAVSNVQVNITILNGSIYSTAGYTSGTGYTGQGFMYGILTGTERSVKYAYNVRVRGVTVSGCGFAGIVLYQLSSVESCLVYNTGIGIQAQRVIDSTAEKCRMYGVYAGDTAVNSRGKTIGDDNTCLGLYANMAINCYGRTDGLGMGLYVSHMANACWGEGEDGEGLASYTLAINCYGWSRNSTGLKADIANSCYGFSLNGTPVVANHKFNMP